MSTDSDTIETPIEARRYRPDIDGLRAIAVAAVVAYHAFPALAPGGFIGVDVFFVISGFLITRIIADERDERRFRFLDFYQRRARRILPAYFLVSAVSAAIAAIVLLPKALHMFGGVLAASSLFLTNLWFANTAVYFSPASHDAPLLHLWSLAVEEQFYLVWPLLITALSLRWIRRLRPILMILLAAGSLFLAERAIEQGAARDAFYYLPGRAWEFLIGGLLGVRLLRAPTSAQLANAAALIGLVLIFASSLLLSDNSWFPGLGALAPCIGAALVIWAGSSAPPLASAVLRTAPMVGLGRISYSLYLWHWPLLVFARQALQQTLPPIIAASLVALAVVLSILSWRFVEQPWRARKGRWIHLGLAIASSAVLIAIGAAFFATQGLPGRMPRGLVLEDADINPMRARCFLGWTPAVDPPASCIAGAADAAAKVLVWGDSHADAVVPGVVDWARPKSMAVRQATRAGCPPLVDTRVLADGRDHDPGCVKFDRNVLSLISGDPSIQLVILSARWPLYMNAKPQMGGYDPPMILAPAGDARPIDLAAALDHTLSVIEASGTKAQLLVIGPVPELPFSPPDCTAQAARFNLDKAHCQLEPDADTLARANPAVEALKAVLARHPKVHAAYPSRHLCSATGCAAMQNGTVLYFDADHLSATGSRRLVPAWLDAALIDP